MRSIVFGFLFLVLFVNAYAQTTNPNEYEEHKPLLYRNEISYGITAHSSGWGLDFRRGFHNTGVKKYIVEGEYITMRAVKEIKTLNPYYDGAKSYVFGKLNALNVLRFGVGEQRTIFTKSERGRIGIQLNYSVGFSLGLAIPVYLQIVSDPGNQYYNYTVERYDPEIHTIDKIVGRGPLFRGIGNLKPYPGAYAKMGFNFDWNQSDDRLSSLETGIMCDLYATDIPIMAFIDNQNVFFNFYISLMFGHKWYTN
jgi:hypothetical protein